MLSYSRTYIWLVDSSLSFLDAEVSRKDNIFIVSVYRKSTFTGFGTWSSSFECIKFKWNGIKTLLSRAYKFSSSFANLHYELIFLTEFFKCNCYPETPLNSHFNKFLSAKYTAPLVSDVSVAKPFFGRQSEQLRDELLLLLSSFYPSFDFTIVLVNSFTIGRLFNYKDKLPVRMRSSLVYEFSCAHCASKYVGSTIRALCFRVAEHAGRSSRTGTF